MKIKEFLEHHGVDRNPFAEEDAQTDPVFKDHCIDSTYHPTWDKVYGDPGEPATSVVMGEKGSGKTAMRLQIAKHLKQHNAEHPEARSLVIHYDDFNPFLDRFRDKLHGRRRSRADKVLAEWKLWDHMDAILSLGVTGLVDRILEVRQPTTSVNVEIDAAEIHKQLDRHQARDLLLLAACYDQSLAETFTGRWNRLKQRLKFSAWRAHLDLYLAIVATLALSVVLLALLFKLSTETLSAYWLYIIALYFLGGVVAWTPYALRFFRRHWLSGGVARRLRVGHRDVGLLRSVLLNFTNSELDAQPLPDKDRTDDRYELLMKFQGIMQSLDYTGIVVLVDRVDEPHLINGSAELMKGLVWPMLDNKFLKHPGLGVKMMLPVELSRFIDREDREFYQRARLDKQNLVPSFEWTGEALYDVANARLNACAKSDKAPTLRMMFDETVTDQRILEAMRSLRVPRRLFKFLYRVLVAHCNAHIQETPVWNISSSTFESTLGSNYETRTPSTVGLGPGDKSWYFAAVLFVARVVW